MSATDGAPRLAVIVANGITGDSRVQKVAIAAARDGWDVTLVGLGTGTGVEESMMGPVKVMRVPVRDHYRKYAAPRQGRSLRRRITQAGLPDKRALNQYGAAHRAWMLSQESRLAAGAGPGVLLNPIRRGWLETRDVAYRFRDRLWRWEQFRVPDGVVPTGDWRRDWPGQVDFDLAFVPVLEDLAPDVVHANDVTTLSIAAQAVMRLRRRGHRVAWLCDVHEYVQGVAWPRPEQASAYVALEREFIARADAVVTVSPQLAEILRDQYALPQTPTVVRNTPVRSATGGDRHPPSVRAAAGVPEGVPLLVYAGWVGPERGLGTAIRALPHLRDVHLAIVAGQRRPELESLLATAAELHVRDRVHVAPYVAQHLIPEYLSSATLGLICFRRTPNCEVSLPTKVPEYLHAGLPMVVSDVRAVREFVEEHGVGEVFPADDTAGFVDAVTRALHRRPELAARITDEVLDELSWEHQSAGLVELYRRIAPRVPAQRSTALSWRLHEPGQVPGLRTWRPLGTTGVRLGAGPGNYAGQAAAFAQAVCRTRADVSAEVFMYQGQTRYGFPADVYLDAGRMKAVDLQMDQVRRVVGRYTHLLADAFRPVFGHLHGRDIGADLPLLHSLGIKVALLGHGGELRHPLKHMERHEFSHYHDAPEGVIERLLPLAERNHLVARASGLPLFVTTPDLLADVPWATWAPLVVDVDAWRCDRPVMERKRPVVLHAPSARWTKGTGRIMPVLEELDRHGTIELRLVEKLAWAEMRAMVQDADVVIDQFTTGAYGTLSCEAMAAGRPAIAYLSDGVKEIVGPELPIVDATPATLRSVLMGLLDDRGRTAKIGLDSAHFAQKFHSGARTAEVLSAFLNQP
jgi:glycosyltransferase involved in cell wall biosynthesis